MMKKITKISILFLSIIICSCSSKIVQQDVSCLQIVDRNGMSETITNKEKLQQYKNINFDEPQTFQKVLRIYNKDKTGNTLSKLTCYHENGLLWKSLEIKNARANGRYQECYSNGNIKIEATVIGGSADFQLQNDWLFDGSCKAYDENGKLISEFNYFKGALMGDAKYYYPSSKIKKLIPYENNEINGEVFEYSENGDIINKSTYKKGKKDGPSIGYWNKDNISFTEDYENNLLMNAQYFKKNRVKITKIKNGDGQKAIFIDDNLHKLIEYKNGIPQGKIQTFQSNGRLINEFYQKNNIKDGQEIEYYNNNEIPNSNFNELHPKLEIMWSNGNIHGQVKTWYKNSILETQKEFSNNKKNGMHFAWYENSEVMFVEEYENDQLIKANYFKINEKTPISTILNGNGIATLFDSKGRFLKKISYKDGVPIQ